MEEHPEVTEECPEATEEHPQATEDMESVPPPWEAAANQRSC